MGRPAAVLLLLTALAVGGCRGIGPAARSQPTPTATPADAHIGVVDVETVARAHPRWPELTALTKKLADVAAQLATPPQLSPVVRARIDARLRAQAKKLEAEFQAEVAALRARQGGKRARDVAPVGGEVAGGAGGEAEPAAGADRRGFEERDRRAGDHAARGTAAVRSAGAGGVPLPHRQPALEDGRGRRGHRG